MNFLLVFPEEVKNIGYALLDGDRARRTFDRHDLAPATKIPVVVRGRGRGEGEIISISKERIEVAIGELLPLIPLNPITAIVAVPRPQTVKKVIHSCTTLGVSALHFVASGAVQKSYLESTSLFPDAIEEEVVNAMEQSGEGVGPTITIHDSFWNFKKAFLDSLQGEQLRFIADTRGTTELLSQKDPIDFGTPLCFAVGPERGWREDELQVFVKNQFNVVSLGPRILRVEIALTVLLGQALLMRSLSNPMKGIGYPIER